MWRWEQGYSQVTTASPQAVWARYADVDGWHRWDPAVDEVELDGAFADGTRGRIRRPGGTSTRFRLRDVRPGRRYTEATRLPLASMAVEHALREEASGTVVTHTAVVRGPLAFLFGLLVGVRVADGLPDTVRRVIRLAEADGL